MARYIKVNPKVVSYLHLENDRNKLKDGNYILWLQDMLPFGPLPRLAETLERIGAIAILPHEAREEQYGINLRPLPTATDPEFVVETTPAQAETEETPAEGDGNDTTEATGEAETNETPAEETTESNEESGEAEADTNTNDDKEE